MSNAIERESGVHGSAWANVHGGYFSDPTVAAPLIGAIRNAVVDSAVELILDLGGGAGHLLVMLREAGLPGSIGLVNLDDSEGQLRAAAASGITCVDKPIDSFSRGDVMGHDGGLLFIMRSVLHYFGRSGLPGILAHIRRQARPGEYFIHQTASYSRDEDAECLNRLYSLMRSPKWYPTVDFLRSQLRVSGWEVTDVLPAPALPLAKDELVDRYGLSDEETRAISRLPEQFDVGSDVYTLEPDGFCAYLHYRIYVCQAV